MTIPGDVEQAMKTLQTFPGIGRWTVDVFAVGGQGRYDAIVFNEVLYYCADPVQVVAQYESCLDKTGVIVVSMFDMLKARKIWQQLNARYRLIEASRAVNHDGHSWSIRVYRPAVG